MFNLNDLISHIIEDYRNQIDNAHIQLMHNSDKTSDYNENNNLVVEADKSRLTQVISNL